MRQPISIFLSTTTKQIHKSSKFCFKHSSGYTSCPVIYIYSYSSTFEKSVFYLFLREKPVSLSNKYVLIGSFLGCLKIIYSMTFCSWTLKNESAFFNSSSYPTLWYKLLCDIIKINLCFVMIWFLSWYPDSMIIDNKDDFVTLLWLYQRKSWHNRGFSYSFTLSPLKRRNVVKKGELKKEVCPKRHESKRDIAVIGQFHFSGLHKAAQHPWLPRSCGQCVFVLLAKEECLKLSDMYVF